jgi:hypothetical protein
MEVLRLSAQAIVRHATVEDADAIGRIRVAAWQAAYRGHMPGDYLDSLDPTANLDDLRAILKSPEPPFLVRVAELGGGLWGSRFLAARATRPAPARLNYGR